MSTPDHHEILQRVAAALDVPFEVSLDGTGLTGPRGMLIRITTEEWVIFSDWDCRSGALSDVEGTASAIVEAARGCL